MMGLEENVMMINEFLEKPEIRLLVIFANQQGLLTPSKQFPNSTKTKAVYFLKRQADAVKKENIKALLIFGDMSHVPLDQLASIVESLLVPIVANQKNQSKWPKVVSQDLMQHMGGLKGDVLVFTGQVRGKTLLPLPPQADSMVKAAEAQATGSMFDKGLVHAVESVVIEWSHQIRNVLSKSSAQPLLEGKTPGPLVEIDFWKARRADLESILDQLYSEKVLKMSSLLEKSMSSYYPAYKAMVTSVVEAQDEARDISIHLKPLRRHIEEMEEGDFKELPQKMLPFFHCMCLVWANSKHYRQPSRLVVLLQEISNMMVQLRIFQEFQELMTGFAGRSDDPTDISNAKFVADHQTFMRKVADMDQRLAYIMCQAFDDCPCCESIFKVSGKGDVGPERTMESAEAMIIHNKYDEMMQLISKHPHTKKISVNFDPQTILDVEYPLIEGKLRSINEQLEKAISQLNWTSDGVWEYIESIRDQVRDLEERVRKSKVNVESISALMATWAQQPLYQRKKDSLLNLEERAVTKELATPGQAGWSEDHETGGGEPATLQAEPGSAVWENYLDYLDDLVVDGLYNCIKCSLLYLQQNMDKGGPKPPPSPGSQAGTTGPGGGVPAEHEAGLVGRVCVPCGGGSWRTSSTWRPWSHAWPAIWKPPTTSRTWRRLWISPTRGRRCRIACTWWSDQATKYCSTFDGYTYLWVDDREEFLRQFLLYGHIPTPEEIEAAGEGGGPEDSTLPWAVQGAGGQVTIAGLSVTVPEGREYKALVEVMGHLFAVKERQEGTDTMFEPLKQTIELLKSYGQPLPEDTDQLMIQLPEQWNNVKKLSAVMKQNVAPLQANECNALRRKLASFDVKQHEFREKFRVTAPFQFDAKMPYVRVDKLKACRKEVGMLKSLWDMVELVTSSFNDWNSTLWKDINVEQMDMDCKKFVKDIRALDKEMRAWDVFNGMDSMVKNMVTSLKAVGELQNPAIRERHWDQLMQATKVKFVMSDKTNLADLLALNLHKFEDEVRTIVDKATKELSMEKTLGELEVTWSQMQFETEPHHRTGSNLLKSNEELIETLEENQVQLQNMMTSKFVGYFLEQVSSWQKRLATSDSVIHIWFEVQRTWSHLESIFIGSEDIRAQLPDHSKQFDTIDSDFKVARHLAKLFDSMAKLKFKEEEAGQPTKEAVGMYSKEGEYVTLSSQLMCVGQVESWLSLLLENMQETIRREFVEAVVTYEEMPREQWIFKPPAQVALAGTQIWWTTEVNLVLRGWRKPTEAPLDETQKHCFANICDAQFKYAYEYLGNTPRLVITPLTDRCYITLTQSLHLIMSGAPAGPAGTGKTETTKDLGRALGVMVSIGNIYKGLAQTGAWGCFDEFNRISVEVLSVVAVQVKSIQDAIKTKKKRFLFEGSEIKLLPSVGLFITMNPGYAGRTELPENLKALFRPCAMVVPDFELIAEIMLVAEGFIDARILARKFLTLYTLCKDLLSKQDHYDWGLRAIKSVLVVAGSLKRGDRERPEDQVLMRALRDFNTPKIVTDDVPIFMGLIGDLFPALDVPRKRDMDFEAEVKKAVIDLGLQPEEGFILKVVQLEELRNVRHSIFVIGNAGTGKSKILRSLNKTYQNMKRKPVWQDLNPKAVTNDELFGIINRATREWKDGLFSTIMRDLANMTNDSPKWIVLDGDIDPMWIESLNTVMDDNKVLTLASNERVPLTPSMRLMFEIGHLKAATPATVSRAGILFVNPADLGWSPYVQSWIEKREVQSEKANLSILFDRYIPILLDAMRSGRFKKITPIQEVSMIQTLCYLLEAFLTPQNAPPDTAKEIYELYFVFAAHLGFWRVHISRPGEWHLCLTTSWTTRPKVAALSEKIPKFELDREKPLQSVIVHTAETRRLRYFLDLLMANRRPIMLVGGAGCGKTIMINDKFSKLGEDTLVTHPFHNYTTSLMLQQIMEKPLEKKAGRNYGPPGTKKLIYFIDDMNMPAVDTYGTVQPHTLIRQHLDYQHWYDRQKLTLKEIHNVHATSVFFREFPGQDPLRPSTQQLQGHLAGASFQQQVVKSQERLVVAALALHAKVASTFLPTAIKFHYIFNLRDLSNIFQGILFTTPECLKTPLDLVRVWLHETCRVYGDKMIEDKDMETFANLKADIVKTSFEDMDQEVLKAEPLIYCHFASGIGEPKYLAVPSWESLKKILEEALDSYNEINAMMNLVLFEDAMQHICRINRILESPRGNALLVGVGGSGKQSLTRLAAFVSSLEVFQIELKKGYSVGDLKTDLAGLYMKAGVKNVGTVFLLTDGQIAEEKFLVLVNDLLASGEIPDLFPDDEVQNIVGSVRNEVKGMGIQDTKENCWAFFIERVRRQLKTLVYGTGVVKGRALFLSVGTTLRVRSRKFPAIVNCTNIDWFHKWPEEALVSVSRRFLSENELLNAELSKSISKFMAFVHGSVNDMSAAYLTNERRYNYTTPKSFLELISLYQNLLTKKYGELMGNMERLEGGLEKLKSTAAQVDDLKEKLKAQEVELKQKNEDADALIKRVAVEQEKVGKEKAFADEEEKKVAKINDEVSKKQRDCETDLAKAEPALKAAETALNTLNKNNLTELKSFGKPPGAVVNVVAAVMVLMSPPAKIPKDRSWNTGKVMMSKVDQFLESLIKFDKENIADPNLKAIRPYLEDPEFEPEFIRSKSFAAAGLCAWAINIVRFYEVFCDVEPKRNALKAANAELAAAQEKLSKIKARIKELDDNLAELTREFETPPLPSSSASRKQRPRRAPYRWPTGWWVVWHQRREDLLNGKWIPFLKTLEPPIPVTEGLDVLGLLTDSAKIARWNNENLPNDRMSIENATILTNAERWPLMIDPQLQGVKWIKTREGDGLKVVRLGTKGYLDAIEQAVSNGDCLLLENIEESVDAVLDPLLGRNTIKKGKCIKIGDKEVEYH
eukprot:Em0265g1a